LISSKGETVDSSAMVDCNATLRPTTILS